MSEAEVLEQKPQETEATIAPAAGDVPIESGKTDGATTETASDSGATQDKPDDKPKTFTQEQLNEILEKRLAKERRKAQREADQRIAEALRQPQSGKSEEPAKAGDKPKPEVFATTEDYVEAVSEWKARQIMQETLTAQEAKRQEAEQRHQQQEMAKQWEAKAEKAEEKYEDFDEVAYNPRTPISQTMAELIHASDAGADLAYYFGKNPDDAARIAQLDPIRAAKEIGKLEVKVATLTQTKPVSRASPPINPIRGGGENLGVELSDADSDAVWLKKRAMQIAAKQKLKRLPT